MSISALFSIQSRLGQILLVFFVLLAFGLIALFITAPDPADIQPVAIKLTPGEEAKLAFKGELNKDSDSDGLREWEEAVYKTDPNNPDTDGDGTSDGDEIKKNRNPLAKGPDDLTTPLAEPNPVTFKIEKGNLTQEFMQKIMNDPEFANSLQNPSADFSETSIEKYLKELPAGGLIGKAEPPNPKTLNISEDQSITAVQKYFEESVLIFIKHGKIFEEQGDDYAVLAKITENPKELAKLDDIITAFEKIIRDANLISIPKNALWFHQKNIILAIKYKNEIIAIRKLFENDPLATVAILSEHDKTKKAIIDLNKNELKPWLLRNNITLLPASRLFFLGEQ